jgi:hypothetical protein
MYLKLASGQGWVFDDSLLVPDDPSVMEMHHSQEQRAHCDRQFFLSTSPTHSLYEANVSLMHSTAASPMHEQSVSLSHPPVTSPLREETVKSTLSANAAPFYASSTAVAAVSLQAPNNQHLPATTGMETADALTLASSWYQVAFCGGISVRVAPYVDAPRTGVTLPCSEVFGVSGSVLGNDQRVYLKLSDGRGWVFDDSMLIPEDRSVVMIQSPPQHAPFTTPAEAIANFAVTPAGAQHMYGGQALDGQLLRPVQAPSFRPHHGARGCRGGAKRNKGRNAQARHAAAANIVGAT